MLKMIYGCGYLGGRVARRWLDTGHQVAALTRSADRAAALRDEGMTTLVGDVCGVLPPVPAAKVVLYSIGFDRSGGNLMREVYVDGLRRVLDSLRTPPERFLYVSSTGVYGNFDGEWVNEASPCEPTREAGRVCLDAERLLAEHPAAEHAVILRLAGIYGPNRLPRSDDLRAGRAIPAPEHGWLNLIHVDDAVEAILAAEAAGSDRRIYLVSDGTPVPRREYLRELARQLGAPEPEFVDPTPDRPGTARATGDKRIDNRRLCEELGFQPRYPSFRHGLAAILAAEPPSESKGSGT